MSALPAYDYAYARPARERGAERRRDVRPDISVVPGGAPARSADSGVSALAFAARIAVVALVVLTALSFVRITLSAQAVTTAIESRQVSAQIGEARAAGNELEVSMSILSSPTRIKTEAAALGMAAPSDIVRFDISGDIVVTDERGALSLSKSVAARAAELG